MPCDAALLFTGIDGGFSLSETGLVNKDEGDLEMNEDNWHLLEENRIWGDMSRTFLLRQGSIFYGGVILYMEQSWEKTANLELLDLHSKSPNHQLGLYIFYMYKYLI